MDSSAGGSGAPGGYHGPSGNHSNYTGFGGGDAFCSGSDGSGGSGTNNGSGLPPGREALLRGYQNRLKGDVRAMLENFQEILVMSRPDFNSRNKRSAEQDHLEIQIRASNMLRAGESLLKLVSDLKQYTVLNDFRSVNESIVVNAFLAKASEAEIDRKLIQLQEDMDQELYEMEDEYYTSEHK